MLRIDFKAKPFFPFKKASESLPTLQKSFSTGGSSKSNYNPLVLVKNSAVLELVAHADTEVAWFSVGEGDELIVQSSARNAISYLTNGVGKYVLTCKDGKNKIDISIVLVNGTIVDSGVEARNGNYTSTVNDSTITIHSGDFKRPAWTASASVQLDGGKQDVNLNSVHVGFVNNLSDLTLKAVYQDGTSIRQEVARTVNGTRSTLELPLLDCDPQKVVEFKGGSSIFMASSEEQIEDQLRRTVASHQPEASLALKSPSGSPLASIAGGFAFKTFLLAYSEDLPFSYAVLGVVDWSVLFDGTVTDGKYKTANTDLVTSATELNTFTNLKDPQQAGCEVRPPAFFPTLTPEVIVAQDGPEGTKQVCTFIKKARKGNIRKKSGESEEHDSTVVVQPKKDDGKNPMIQSTKDMKKQKEDFSFASTNSAMSNISADLGATAMIETETERDKDAQAIRERSKKDQEILAGDEAEKAEKIYRGMGAYTEYVQKRDSTGGIKGTGIKAGPVRGALYARAISRMDYQPDVCKDYKETGTCGYGISCKFLHDRGDYKNSVELEREWEQEQAAKKARLLAAAEEEERAKRDSDDEDTPFACTVCRKAFTNPVKTKCGHFFCEKCALKMPKCRLCGADTNKVFKSLTPPERAKLDKARLKFERRSANEPTQEEEPQPE